MPLRPTRVGRVGVIRAPVAKTAVVAAAVTPGRAAGGEDRRRGRRRHPEGGPSANLTSIRMGFMGMQAAAGAGGPFLFLE